MNQTEFEAIQATFPWTERVITTGIGGLIQVIDNQGREVSLFTMTRFLEMITAKLSKRTEKEEV